MKTTTELPKYNVQGGINGLTIRGNSWPGMSMKLEEELTPGSGTWTPIDLTGALIECDFKLEGTTQREFSSSGGGIVITSAVAGEFEFSPINNIDLPEGVLHGNLKITLNSGLEYCYCQLLWAIYSDTNQ